MQTGNVFTNRPKVQRRLSLSDIGARAKCRGLDPEEFYVELRAQPDAAKHCLGCPVIEACLEYALTRPEVFGVWGGMTERQRESMRRERRRAMRRQAAVLAEPADIYAPDDGEPLEETG